jgi:hypothetical protein
VTDPKPSPAWQGRCTDAYPHIGWTHDPGYLAVGCCWSCHEDEERGYPLSEVELPNGQTAEVCCHVSTALKEDASA